MKQPLWQRGRRERPDRDDPADAPTDDEPAPTSESVPADGGIDSTRRAADLLDRLRDLREGPAAADAEPPPRVEPNNREATYAAWAERMRSHKAEKLAGLTPDPADAEKPTVSPHWDSSTLFVSTVDETRPTPALMGTRELLAIFALDDGATTSDVQAAFRRLAKEHHPDRWHDAPTEVREEHAEHMSLVVEVHRELRQRLA